MMTNKYPLSIKNVGDNTYMLLSKGHHCLHEFMKTVRLLGYDWPLSSAQHVWLKAVPNNVTGETTYHQCNSQCIGAFPATLTVEAYGEEHDKILVQWTGDNLKEVLHFTGKSDRFEQWFPNWEAYEAHVKNDGNQFKIIKSTGNEVAQVGDWIYRDVDGLHSVVSSS